MLLRTVAHRNMSTTRLYRYYRGKTNSYRGENFYRYIANDKISPIPTVHTPNTACPLYMAPQPVVEATVWTTACLETCSRGSLAHRNARSDHGVKVSGHGHEASAEAVSYCMKQPQRCNCHCSCHMPQEPLKCIQWDRCPALEWIQAVQHRPRTFLCEACCLFDRIQLHTEKRDPLRRGEFALFPVDPKTQLAEVEW